MNRYRDLIDNPFSKVSAVMKSTCETGTHITKVLTVVGSVLVRVK